MEEEGTLFTLNPKGTPYGYAQIPEQAGRKRLPLDSPIKGLYFASAWAFPGGGFTGAILSGFLCARKVNKETKFKSHNVRKIEDERIVKLLQKNIIADNTLELVFEKPLNFRFIPGQYAVVHLNTPTAISFDLPFRSIPICSHPSEAVLRFAMRVSESSFKKSCTAMEVGDTATIYGPMGHFILKEHHQDLVFLVSGIGITPIVPILKELERLNHPGKVFLFYSNKASSCEAFHHLLQNIKLPRFKYIPVFTEIQSRINEEMIKKTLVNFSIYNFFIVGGTGFIKDMKDILQCNQVALEHIQVDDFG